MSELRFLPIPEATRTGRRIQPFERKSIERVREMMERDAYVRDGVRYWKSNDRPVPKSTYVENHVELPEAQAAAADEWTERTIARIRADDAPPTDEALVEMRAEFGPGATVVDVITGRRTRL